MRAGLERRSLCPQVGLIVISGLLHSRNPALHHDPVNDRVVGRFYAVDRLFAAAELRLGGKKQAIVRITRTGKAAARQGRGA